MTSVAHVDNYKTILKSNRTLLDKQEQAERLKIELDEDLVKEISACQSRLTSERDLRHEMATQSVPKSEKEDVAKIDKLIQDAFDCKVEGEYLEQANKLKSQMDGNIKAREILQMLVEYPERVYPDPPPLDAKGKPIKQKDDPKKKKKRRKKADNFPMPEWAMDLDVVQKQVKEIQSLASNAKELQLDQDFLSKEHEQMKRFKKEIEFRKQALEEARLEAEAKAAAKKKKKK